MGVITADHYAIAIVCVCVCVVVVFRARNTPHPLPPAPSFHPDSVVPPFRFSASRWGVCLSHSFPIKHRISYPLQYTLAHRILYDVHCTAYISSLLAVCRILYNTYKVVPPRVASEIELSSRYRFKLRNTELCNFYIGIGKSPSLPLSLTHHLLLPRPLRLSL